MNFIYLENFMRELSEKNVPGNSVAVYLGGKRVFDFSSGYASIEEKKPMTGSEYLNIYSCSKITTVTAALQLLEKGKITASDPLYYYIPEFRHMSVKTDGGELVPAKNYINIRNLFTMTAGFSYDLSMPGFARARDLTGGRMDTVTVAKCIAADPLYYDPGEHWHYSIAHDILAAVVSVVSGKKFRDYVKENIFDPLGMDKSFYHATDEIKAGMCEQYRYVQGDEKDIVSAQKSVTADGGYIENAGKDNPHILGEEYDSGGAGIITTVRDYAKLAAALANFGLGLTGERILAAGTVELLRTNALDDKLLGDFDIPYLIGYGYGYGVRTLVNKALAGSTGSVGEFGWGGAAGATMLVDPKYNLGVFYAHHMLNPREDYYQPRLRNVIYTCLNN